MPEKVLAPKGTYDVLPEDQSVRRWVIDTAVAIFERYGYRRIDTPLFEETRLFSRGVGGSTDIVRKEMYTFEDLGGRSMTLRPEGTAPVARAYVEHGMHRLPQPVKLYYHSAMFRYESPQSGRFRQHHQLGVEAIGSSSPESDAEVIGTLAALYGVLGLSDVRLRLNSMGCKECRPAYSEELKSFLAAHEDCLCGDCKERAMINPLRVYDCKVESCRSRLAEAPRLLEHLCPECAAHHAAVESCLVAQGITYEADPTLVRGMDYYTRTTFEFVCASLGAQSGVGGGGRYDDLIKDIGGPDVPGVGFGTGVERILLALPQSVVEAIPRIAPTAYVVAMGDEARGEVFALVHELRSAGLSVELDLAGRSPKGQMTQAGRNRVPYALIIGDREIGEKSVTVRDMEAGEEMSVSRNSIRAFLEENCR